MARDYKHRIQSSSYANNRRRPKKAPTMWWRWLLVAALIGAFIVFLNMIRNMIPDLMGKESNSAVEQQSPVKQLLEALPKTAIPTTQNVESSSAEKKDDPAVASEPEEPRYDFYTILPQAETVIPDYEIKSRVREELVGKSKPAKYVMQAGSFREAAEAERHIAKLALLGIQSRVEKAKVGNVIWHRVKVGPYDNPSSVSTIKELLQKNGIGVIVTELGQQQ